MYRSKQMEVNNLAKKISRIKHIIKYPIQLLLYQFGVTEKKIFAIGFNKSGTTSLHYLFKEMGFSSYHGTSWRKHQKIRFFLYYRCFSDGKPSDELAKLDKLFPGSKFILQVRELNSWIYSRLEHIERQKQENRNETRGQYWDNTEKAVKMWIKERNEYHTFVLSYFSKRPSDLLIINYIRDELASEKICEFLSHNSKVSKPKKNVNPQKKLSA